MDAAGGAPAAGGKSDAVRTTLSELAAVGADGTLYVDADPVAAICLRSGLVCHIDTAAATDVGTVLLASGRLALPVWEAAMAAAAGAGRVGPLLVEDGHLSQGELECAALGALYDAAFFVLGARPRAVRFAEGHMAWLGAPVAVAVDPLWREVQRRRRLLDEVLPTAAFDTAPVTPVPRLSRQQVVLDGLRWELLVHADGQRRPVELARKLGRAAFAVILEIRRMAAAGLLLRPPPSTTRPRDQDGATPAQPPASALPRRRRRAAPDGALPATTAPATTAPEVTSPSSGLAFELPTVQLLTRLHKALLELPVHPSEHRAATAPTTADPATNRPRRNGPA